MKKTFSTKLQQGGVKVTTEATIDFTGVSQEQMEELASATVIINQQAIYRTSRNIPKSDTIKVVEQLARPRGAFVPTPENIAARMLKLSDEDYKRILVEQVGLNEHQANKLVATRAKPLAAPVK